MTELPVELSSPELSPAPLAICTQGLAKRFDRYTALQDVDLDVGVGEVYGLIGPNGAGKTTLIRLLATAEEPTLGDILIHGEKLRYDRPQTHLKQTIGYLPDDYPLYDDLAVWDYLDYFARLYHLRGKQRTRRLHEVLEWVNLTHKRDSAIGSLSRGMKQRLGLARTIIHNPSILLLDEPVSGLDPIARQEFRTIIKMLQSVGMTILISSHILSDLAELCSAIGILEFGFLVESASLAELYDRLSHSKLVLATRGERSNLCQHLQQFPGVEAVELVPDSDRVEAQFSGHPDDAAALLKSLIEAGISVYEFHRVQETLEDIFFKLGHTQST